MKKIAMWSLYLGLMVSIAACDSAPPPPSENAPAGPSQPPPGLDKRPLKTPRATARPARAAPAKTGALVAPKVAPSGTERPRTPPSPQPAKTVLEPSAKGPGFGIVPTALPASNPAAPESAVYFWVREVGAVRLGDKGFRRIPKTQREYCRDLTRGPNGGARLVGWQVADLSAAGLATVASRAETGNTIHDRASFGPGDQVAVSKFRDVWWRSSAGWQRANNTDIGFDQGAIKGSAIDGAGRLWLLTSYGLYVRDGETWKAVFDTSPQAKKLIFSDLRLLSDGRLLLVASSGLAVYDGARLAWHSMGGFMNKSARLGPKGLSYVIGFNAVSVVEPKGFGVVRGFALAESETGATRIDQATVDGQGRTWLATDTGIIILDRALTPTHWPTGSIPALAGRIVGLVAVGNGPATLRPAGAIRTGTIHGVLQVGDHAAANAAIEICDMPRLSFNISPCTGRPGAYRATTNAQGEFTFEGVPVSAYSVMAEVSGEWRRAALSVCAGMIPDQTCDTKTLTIRPR